MIISHVSRFIDLNEQKFIIKPRPIEGELLSSWIARVARAHLTKTASFTNMHFKEYPNNMIWQRDLDMWCPDNLIKKIAFKSDYSEDIIFNMTLRSFENIFSKKITGLKCIPEIRPLYRNKKPGLFYCPECLKEDKIPYFRKIWRLKDYTICEKHKIELLKSCPNCKTPLNISKTYREKDFTFCFKCGDKLNR